MIVIYIVIYCHLSSPIVKVIIEAGTIVDFGDEGVDIVETINLEYPKARRSELSNDQFDFEQELVYKFVRVQTKSKNKKAAGSSDQVMQSQRYPIKVLKFGGEKI